RYRALGKNRGMAIAGNEAMRHATGEYLVFLDEDDEFFADHVEQLVAELLRFKSKVAYSLAFEVPTKSGKNRDGIVAEGEYKTVYNQPFSLFTLFHHNFMPNLTVMFHRSLFEKYGGMDPELDAMDDWNLWVKYATKVKNFTFLPKTTAMYRVPIDPKEYDKRFEYIKSFYDLARKKQDHLNINTTVGEIANEYSNKHAQKRD
ncbi:unnamed protein product, partial [marine sediment metagenome]